MSKRIEFFFLGQLLCHLDQNNLWHTFQSAYCSKHSTETTLLRVFNDLLTASDSGSISILTFVDLSSAFDIIDHGILLTRLKITFSIFYLALSFSDSYLQGRTEAVTPNEVKSSPSLPTSPALCPGTKFFSFCILSLFLM